MSSVAAAPVADPVTLPNVSADPLRGLGSTNPALLSTQEFGPPAAPARGPEESPPPSEPRRTPEAELAEQWRQALMPALLMGTIALPLLGGVLTSLLGGLGGGGGGANGGASAAAAPSPGSSDDGGYRPTSSDPMLRQLRGPRDQLFGNRNLAAVDPSMGSPGNGYGAAGEAKYNEALRAAETDQALKHKALENSQTEMRKIVDEYGGEYQAHKEKYDVVLQQLEAKLLQAEKLGSVEERRRFVHEAYRVALRDIETTMNQLIASGELAAEKVRKLAADLDPLAERLMERYMKDSSLDSTTLDRLVDEVARQESGYNFGAVNRHSGAEGAWQMLPVNRMNWSRELFGAPVSRERFLADPSIQRAIARAKLGTYLTKYGYAGAKKAWYGGEGAVYRRDSSKRYVYGDTVYPSLDEYARRRG